jgi:hypothetical protein
MNTALNEMYQETSGIQWGRDSTGGILGLAPWRFFWRASQRTITGMNTFICICSSPLASSALLTMESVLAGCFPMASSRIRFRHLCGLVTVTGDSPSRLRSSGWSSPASRSVLRPQAIRSPVVSPARKTLLRRRSCCSSCRSRSIWASRRFQRSRRCCSPQSPAGSFSPVFEPSRPAPCAGGCCWPRQRALMLFGYVGFAGRIAL